MAKLSVRPTDNKKKKVIELVDLVKQFGGKTVLKDLNLAINKGEFVSLLGPSGCGKTTALRLIGGFEWPTRGEIKFYGVDVKDLPAYKRPTNTIFQDYALFPHLTVEGNIKYGLKLVKVPKEHINENALIKLDQLKQKWAEVAKQKMAKLDKEQAEYEKVLETARPKSPKYKKAQKWMDKSDFVYSYWENFVLQKEESYRRIHTQRKLTSKEIKEEVNRVITLIGLEGNEKKSIDQLSGGMKQRVAIARAIVTKPEVLLLDEPLSALDMKVRQKMQRELKAIQRKLGITFIFVTHDQEEAMTMSDRIAVMRDGRIEQFDVPKKIYDYPANAWIASFVGDSTMFKGVYVKPGQVKFLDKVWKCEPYKIKPGKLVDIMLRPEDFEFTTAKKAYFKGKITKKIFQGAMWEYTVITENKVSIVVETNKAKKIGEEAFIRWDHEDLHVMLSETQE